MVYSFDSTQPTAKLREAYDSVEALLSNPEILPAELRIKLDTFRADLAAMLEDRQDPAQHANMMRASFQQNADD